MSRQLIDTLVAEGFSSFTANTILRATVLLCLATIVAAALRRSSSSVRHRLWSLSLCGLIAIPPLSWLFPGWPLPVLPSLAISSGSVLDASRHVGTSPSDSRRTEETEFLESAKLSRPNLELNHTEDALAQGPRDVASPAIILPGSSPSGTGAFSNADENGWNFTWIVGALWAMGFLAAVSPTLVAGIHNEWRRRRSRRIEDSKLLELFDEVVRLFAPRRRVELRMSTTPGMPVTWGITRPVILLPGEATRWSEPTRRLVLLHELAHIVRWDVFHQLIGRLAASVFWFHPLAWYALHRLRVEGESACDDAVIQMGIHRADYAQQLVDLVRALRPSRSAAAVALVRKNGLEQRIRALLDEGRSHRPVSCRLAQGMLVGLLLVLACLTCTRPVPSIAAPPADTGASAKPAVAYPPSKPLASVVANINISPVGEVPKATRAVDTGKMVVLRGKVVGLEGRPVAGARLHLSTDSWIDPIELGTTGADGSYGFSVPEKSFYHFEDGVSTDIHARLIVVAADLGADWVDIPAIERAPGSLMMVPEYVHDFNLGADLPIEGRVVDAAGQPVVGASVAVSQIFVPVERRNWEPVLTGIKDGNAEPLKNLWNDPSHWRTLSNRTAWKTIPAGATDANGRFRIGGVGRDRLAYLTVSGPGIRTLSYIAVLTRDDVDDITRAIRVKYPRTPQPDGYFNPPRPGKPPMDDGVQAFGPNPTIEVDPGRTVSGVVRDAETGKPIPNVSISMSMSDHTDGRGRFHILRGDDASSILAYASIHKSDLYLPAVRRLDNARKLGGIVADFDLPRGVVIEGRVIESGTGRPMVTAPQHTCHVPGPGLFRAGYIHYFPLSTNAALRDTPTGTYFEETPSSGQIYLSAMIGEGGRFHIAVPPGPGVLLVQASPGLPMFGEFMTWKESEGFHRLFPYTTLTGRSTDDGAPGTNQQSFATFSGAIEVNRYHAYRVINPSPDAKSVDLTITIPRAPSRVVRFVGPDGNPTRGVRVQGLVAPHTRMTTVLDGSEAEVLALAPGEARALTAISNDGKLAARTTVTANDSSPQTIHLDLVGKSAVKPGP